MSIVLVITSHGGGLPYKQPLTCTEGIRFNKYTLAPRGCSIIANTEFQKRMTNAIYEKVKFGQIDSQHNDLKQYLTELAEHLICANFQHDMRIHRTNSLSQFSSQHRLSKKQTDRVLDLGLVSYSDPSVFKFFNDEIYKSKTTWQKIILRANHIISPKLSKKEEKDYETIKKSMFEMNSCNELYDKIYTPDPLYPSQIYAVAGTLTEHINTARWLKSQSFLRRLSRDDTGIIPPIPGESFDWNEIGGSITLQQIYDLYVQYGYDNITIIDLSCDSQSCEGSVCRGGERSKLNRRKTRKTRKNGQKH
jgi:hypothetical protein